MQPRAEELIDQASLEVHLEHHREIERDQDKYRKMLERRDRENKSYDLYKKELSEKRILIEKQVIDNNDSCCYKNKDKIMSSYMDMKKKDGLSPTGNKTFLENFTRQATFKGVTQKAKKLTQQENTKIHEHFSRGESEGFDGNRERFKLMKANTHFPDHIYGVKNHVDEEGEQAPRTAAASLKLQNLKISHKIKPMSTVKVQGEKASKR